MVAFCTHAFEEGASAKEIKCLLSFCYTLATGRHKLHIRSLEATYRLFAFTALAEATRLVVRG